MNNEEAKEILSKVKELPCGWCYEGGDEFKKAINLAIKALEEKTQGEWKHIGGDEWCCSECGRVVTTEGSWETPLDIGDYHCPNCGAKMKGGAE